MNHDQSGLVDFGTGRPLWAQAIEFSEAEYSFVALSNGPGSDLPADCSTY